MNKFKKIDSENLNFFLSLLLFLNIIFTNYNIYGIFRLNYFIEQFNLISYVLVILIIFLIVHKGAKKSVSIFSIFILAPCFCLVIYNLINFEEINMNSYNNRGFYTFYSVSFILTSVLIIYVATNIRITLIYIVSILFFIGNYYFERGYVWFLFLDAVPAGNEPSNQVWKSAHTVIVPLFLSVSLYYLGGKQWIVSKAEKHKDQFGVRYAVLYFTMFIFLTGIFSAGQIIIIFILFPYTISYFDVLNVPRLKVFGLLISIALLTTLMPIDIASAIYLIIDIENADISIIWSILIILSIASFILIMDSGNFVVSEVTMTSGRLRRIKGLFDFGPYFSMVLFYFALGIFFEEEIEKYLLDLIYVILCIISVVILYRKRSELLFNIKNSIIQTINFFIIIFATLVGLMLLLNIININILFWGNWFSGVVAASPDALMGLVFYVLSLMAGAFQPLSGLILGLDTVENLRLVREYGVEQVVIAKSFLIQVSFVTAPFGISVIAAAVIAKTPLWSTSLAAMRYSWPIFTLPLMFLYSPAFTFVGTPVEILWTFAAGFFGLFLISTAFRGYRFAAIPGGLRWLLALAGLCAVFPPLVIDAAIYINIVGLLAGGALLWLQWRRRAPQPAF